MLKVDEKLPLYQQIKEYFVNKIEAEEIANGELLPSENEIVKNFNVSRHTVRQAFALLENEGYIKREQGRGTICLGKKKTHSNRTIAVVTTYISDYIFPHIINGIEDVLSSKGYTLSLASTNNNKDNEALFLQKFIDQKVAGMIIEPTKSAKNNPNLDYFLQMEQKNIKYIMLHATYPNINSAFVVMDDIKGGYLATKYLLQLGHKNIAGIFKSDDIQGAKRQQGFINALKEYNIMPDDNLIGNYTTENMNYYPYQFTSYLINNNKPTAIVCYNDQIAMKVIDAIKDNGLKIPDDISIVGYDDSSFATASEVKLTTISHPKKEMGKQVANFLLDMLDKIDYKPRYTYEPELIVRTSCRNI
ncbi:MAG: GntR family transcriptional regulator [Xylanivirga thermophila]|jgi:GntR family transcriptional regulator, arabinose operon transcriptional repressor|uniref:GntR family transcriptional regulator n=1 Tax=Xylanivirga thermophila TaxID=2496273 RepID=UPI00101BB8DC|nr:GntR family transcriptional regulator [Xylanivirga thermophila]